VFRYRHISVYSPVRPSEIKYVGSNPAIVRFLYSLSQAFGNKLRWFESRYRHISVFSPVRPSETNNVGSISSIGVFLYVAYCGLLKQTTLVRFPLSSYISMYSIQAFGIKLRWFRSRYPRISLCSPFRLSETNYVGSIPSIGVFPYVDHSRLRKQTTSFRVPLSAYFCI
jgi:hypothetical protein